MVPSWFSREMENCLIAHIDGPRPIIVAQRWGMQTRKALLRRGLLRTDQRHPPRVTMITEAGRKLVAKVLGYYADVLVKAGYDEPRIIDEETTLITEQHAGEPQGMAHPQAFGRECRFGDVSRATSINGQLLGPSMDEPEKAPDTTLN